MKKQTDILAQYLAFTDISVSTKTKSAWSRCW